MPPTAGPSSVPVEPSALTEFVSFSSVHVATVAVCAALMIGACRMGASWRGSERERRLRHAWGWAIVVVKSLETWYWFSPGVYRFEESLPLQLCDLAAVTAALAMLTQWRVARTLLYFWGIGLSTQAFATPTLERGLAHLHFWYFWSTHLMIVGSAVYDLIVLGYRPHLRDVIVASAVTLTWVGGVTILNALEGTNYGYIGNMVPDKPTVINKLGPWPGRLFIVIGIVASLFVAMWVIWPLWYRMLGRRYPSGDAPAPGGAAAR